MTPEKEILYWDTRKNTSHSVRTLCDNSGLNWNEKNLIWACIMQESNMQNYLPDGQPVTHKNPTNTDWGIVQINDHYHIGPGKDFPSVEYVLANPQACVQYMIDMYKSGRLSMWVSYTSGEYKKFLPYSPIL